MLVVALFAAGCGGSPTGPSAPLVSAAPVLALMIQTTPCPNGGDPYYREIACNGLENPNHPEPVRRWTIAPKVYIRTVDQAGAPIDAVTLDTVQAAMVDVAPAWSGGRFGLASVERGTDTREGVSGWITVKWPAPDKGDFYCGLTQQGTDGGWIELHYAAASNCGCLGGGSKIKPVIAKHELGHALGYWHTDGTGYDIMSPQSLAACDASPSAREIQAAAYHYR